MVFELHKAKCVSASYILSFVYIFSCYCLVAIAGFVPVTLVYKIPLRYVRNMVKPAYFGRDKKLCFFSRSAK